MEQNFARSSRKIAFFVGLSLVTLVFPFSAKGQCGFSGDALSKPELFTQKASVPELKFIANVKNSSLLTARTEFDEDEDGAIVGLWRTDFNITIPGVPDRITIQTAFQIWNLGGTEVHNPKVDPRGGSVCLGAWKQSRGVYKLAHRVWSYAPDGTFLGTINLTEVVRVTNRGKNHTGVFTLDFFDPDGNPLEVPGVHPAHVEGVVAAERISPN